MNSRRIALILTLAIVVSVIAYRAFLRVPTSLPADSNPAAPKLAGGLPDFNAAAPKKGDGKPDLSGIWEPEKNRPCPPEGCADQQIGHQFMDIGWGLSGGLPFQPWAADLVRERMKQNGKDDPGSHCLPTGIVKMHTTPFYRKIVQTPGLLIILNERDAAYRQIFTDGRPMPVDVDLPSANGYSIGHWEGDTLVVDSAGFKDGIWLDRNGSPLTDTAKISEKFRRVNFGKLEIEVTINDPKAYTKPWTIKLNQIIVPDRELTDTICIENEKDAASLLGK